MRSKFIYLLAWIVITLLVTFLFPVLAIGVYHIIFEGEPASGGYIEQHYYDFFVNGLLASFIISLIITGLAFLGIEELSDDYKKVRKGKKIYEDVQKETVEQADLTKKERKLAKKYKRSKTANKIVCGCCTTGIIIIVVMVIILLNIT